MDLKAVELLSPGNMDHVVGQRPMAHGKPVLTCLEAMSIPGHVSSCPSDIYGLVSHTR